MYTYVMCCCFYLNVCVYIYVWRERGTDRERERGRDRWREGRRDAGRQETERERVEGELEELPSESTTLALEGLGSS